MSERARLWEPLVERTLVCFHAHQEPTEPPAKLGRMPPAKLGRMDHDLAAPTASAAVSDGAAAAAPPSAAAADPAVSGGGADGAGAGACAGSAVLGVCGGSASTALGPNLEASRLRFMDRLSQTVQRPSRRLSAGPPDLVAPSTAPARGRISRGANGSGSCGNGSGGGGGVSGADGAVTGASTSSSSSSSSSSSGGGAGEADASTTRLRVWLPRRLNINISQQYLRFGRRLVDFLDAAKDAVEGAAAGTSLYEPLHASISSEDGATLIRNAKAIAPPPPPPPALHRSGGGGARHGARATADPRSGSLIRKAEVQSPLDVLGALPWAGPEVWLVSAPDCH